MKKLLIEFLIDEGFIDGTEFKTTRKPTHGVCCTCQKCGWSHDDCICEHNFRLNKLMEILELNK